jgi:hypothetical protein
MGRGLRFDRHKCIRYPRGPSRAATWVCSQRFYLGTSTARLVHQPGFVRKEMIFMAEKIFFVAFPEKKFPVLGIYFCTQCKTTSRRRSSFTFFFFGKSVIPSAGTEIVCIQYQPGTEIVFIQYLGLSLVFSTISLAFSLNLEYFCITYD